MQVGIYKQHFGGLHEGYLQKYAQILKFNSIDCLWLEADTEDFWQKISQLNLFIYQWEHYDTPRQIAHAIIPIIQYQMRIPCFPNWQTSWHFDDKIKQYYLLKQHEFPVIESYIFWHKDTALKWLKSAQMPLIFKLKCGAGSSNVILVKSEINAKRLISRMFCRGIRSGYIFDVDNLYYKSLFSHSGIKRSLRDFIKKILGRYSQLYWQIDKDYVFFQKFLPNNIFDTRVSVIGNRAFAFRRFNRQNDFRASGSGRIDYDIEEIDMRSIKIAFNISKKFGFQSMSYDFLINAENELEISEISYTYVDTAVYNCPGFWDSDLNWHEGHFWPQYCQLMDALMLPGLRQPELSSRSCK